MTDQEVGGGGGGGLTLMTDQNFREQLEIHKFLQLCVSIENKLASEFHSSHLLLYLKINIGK